MDGGSRTGSDIFSVVSALVVITILLLLLLLGMVVLFSGVGVEGTCSISIAVEEEVD